ncbi:hypothetical protein DFH06DRAFT_1204105 [Mycena polygramma]|nr:hypothetical protein DFH06DRAFT_1204105 [Mycena polygramma]
MRQDIGVVVEYIGNDASPTIASRSPSAPLLLQPLPLPQTQTRYRLLYHASSPGCSIVSGASDAILVTWPLRNRPLQAQQPPLPASSLRARSQTRIPRLPAPTCACVASPHFVYAPFHLRASLPSSTVPRRFCPSMSVRRPIPDIPRSVVIHNNDFASGFLCSRIQPHPRLTRACTGPTSSQALQLPGPVVRERLHPSRTLVDSYTEKSALVANVQADARVFRCSGGRCQDCARKQSGLGGVGVGGARALMRYPYRYMHLNIQYTARLTDGVQLLTPAAGHADLFAVVPTAIYATCMIYCVHSKFEFLQYAEVHARLVNVPQLQSQVQQNSVRSVIHLARAEGIVHLEMITRSFCDDSDSAGRQVRPGSSTQRRVSRCIAAARSAESAMHTADARALEEAPVYALESPPPQGRLCVWGLDTLVVVTGV